jgi:phosphatidylglycerol:prolipoprotein diacylglycerol transferase
VRFFIEYFREPDADIGYRISSEGAAIYTNSSLLNISTGQIFCFAMIILGAAEILILFLLNRKRQKNDAA